MGGQTKTEFSLLPAADQHAGADPGQNGLRQLPGLTGGQVAEIQHLFTACKALRHCGKDLFLQTRAAVFRCCQPLIDLPGGIAGLQHLGGKGLGNLPVLVENLVKQVDGPLAADHFDPHALMEFHAAEQLDPPYMERAGQMHRAAGAGINAGDPHNTNGPIQRFFTAVGQHRQLLRAGEKGLDGQIIPNGGVGILFHL